MENTSLPYSDLASKVISTFSQPQESQLQYSDTAQKVLDWTNGKQTQNPDDVASAQKDIGDKSYNDLCERFVEQQVYGKTGIFPSAVDAWNSYVKNGSARAGIKGIQPGDLIYFTPNQSNQGFGHTGIYAGNNQFISATSNGVQTEDLHNWQSQTQQQVLGYIPHQ